MSALPIRDTEAVARALRNLPVNASRQAHRIVTGCALTDKPRKPKTLRGLATTIRHGCDHDWFLRRYEVWMPKWQGVVRDGAPKTWARFKMVNLENGNRHTVDVFVGPDGELMATCDESCVMFTDLEHGHCLHCEFVLSGLEEQIHENDRAIERLGLDDSLLLLSLLPAASESRSAENRFHTAPTTTPTTTAATTAYSRTPQPVSAAMYRRDWED